MTMRAAAAVVLVAMMATAAGGDMAADRAECSSQLVGLATCLTFVRAGAPAAAPTPDCCAGLKTVLAASRKCLCVLIKDKDDPSLGLDINVTRALALPAACKAPANISDCPNLLHLPPSSKDAEVFEQYAKQMEAANATTGGSSGPNAGAPQKNGAATNATPQRWWLGVGGARAAVLSSIFALPFLLLLG